MYLEIPLMSMSHIDRRMSKIVAEFLKYACTFLRHLHTYKLFVLHQTDATPEPSVAESNSLNR